MGSYLLHLLCAYFIGGITFIPICCTLLFLYFNSKVTSEKKIGDNKNNNNKYVDPLLLVGVDPKFKAGELEELQNVNVEMSGYMYITNQYYYHSTELIENPNLSQDSTTSDPTNKDAITPNNSSSNSDSKDNDTQMILNRSQLKSKQRFYVTLKHGNLFLYKEMNNTSNSNNINNNDLLHAISLKDCFVSIWPRNYYDTFDQKYHPLTDGQLFTKRTCIAIFKNGSVQLEEPSDGNVGIRNNNLQFNINLNRNVDGTMNLTDISTLNGEKFLLINCSSMDLINFSFTSIITWRKKTGISN